MRASCATRTWIRARRATCVAIRASASMTRLLRTTTAASACRASWERIVRHDTSIFMGLIKDLFPNLDVPRKRDMEFEKLIKTAAVDLKLQPEDGFILKVVQLQELFEVRHSVFIVGNAGTGKSQIWKTLQRTYQNQKRKPIAVDLNPKAVTNDELFGML